ncbi:MAG: lipoate--protein ligase family protein [Acidiferrobacter sp.]
MTLHWHKTALLDPGALDDYERTMLAALSPGEARLGFVHLQPCALIGAFDDPNRSLRRSYVDGRLAIVRRRTGGGSLYVDPGTTLMVAAIPRQLLPKHSLTEVIATIGETMTAALRGLDIDVAFTAPNDIGDDGRKTGAVFAVFAGDVILVEAALLLSVDIETLLKVLKLPLEKLSAAGLLAAGRRFAPIGGNNPTAVAARVYPAIVEALATRLGLGAAIAASPVVGTRPLPTLLGAPSPGISAFLKTEGGVLYLDVTLDGQVVRDAHFTGGIQCAHATDLIDLGSAVAGTAVADLEEAVRAAAPLDALGFGASDLGYLARLCAERHLLGTQLGLPADAERVTLFSPRRDQGFAELLANTEVLLLPYCAKPAWCKWRTRDGCPECGHCAVGEAYRMGRERDLRVVTITRYEHLSMVLAEMKANGVRAFLGVCCTEFFLKRDYAFIEAGIGAVFIDIGGDTCYALRAEESAYQGQFTAEATLDAQLLERVLMLRD